MSLDNNSIIDTKKIVKEAEVHPGGTMNIEQMQDLFNKAKEGICRIVFKNNGYGTGFFCKIEDPYEEEKIIKALFTCNHVLNEEYINKNKKITLEFNKNEKILDLNNRRIWSNSELDYTCIEIFKNDNIKYFFNIDENITNFNYSIENYDKKGIFIFGIMKNLQLGFDSGYIERVKEPNMLYNCNTNPGSSGGAIIEKINNTIIGIHTGSYDNKKHNIGIFIKSVINDIKNNKSFKIIENINENNKKEINKEESKEKNNEKLKKNYNYIFEIIVIGEHDAGKTYLIKKITGEEILMRHDFFKKIIKLNNKSVKLKFFDTAGQERYTNLVSNCLRIASCIIIVYNIRNRRTFDLLNRWIEELNDNYKNNNPKILIGNDFPLDEKEKREVSYSEGKDYALKNNLTFYEVSLDTDFDSLLKSITKEIIEKIPEESEKNIGLKLNKVNITNNKSQGCI